jgi:HEAT repeat protein
MTRPARGGALAAIALLAFLGSWGCAPADDPDKLLRGLSSPDGEVREESSERLDAIVRKNDASVFLRGLDSQDMLVRAQAITFLSRMTSPEARAALRGLLAGDRRMLLPYNPIRLRPESMAKTDSRILVASLIQRTGPDPKAIGVLLEGAEQAKTIDELVGTCLAIGALRDPAGLPFLDRAALHPEAEVVRAAVQAMAPFEGPEVLPSLRRLATDPRDEVRADVVVSAANHSDPEAASILMLIGAKDRTNEIRMAAWEALSRQPADVVVPYFIEQLRAAGAETRPTLVEILGRQTGQSFGAKPEAWAKFWATAHPPTATR